MRRTLLAVLACSWCLLLFEQCKNEKTYRVLADTLDIKSPDEIIPLTDSLVRPVLYSHIPRLNHLPVPQIKERFVAAVLPSILIARHNIALDRDKIERLKEKRRWNPKDSAFYRKHLSLYKGADIDDLLNRMLTIPNSIALAQAAIESGWGQSRFFQEGNNVYGVWSYNRFEPRLEAARTREKKKIYLRAYGTVAESVQHYFVILSSARPYASLRATWAETNDPYILLPHLRNFSERREAYTRQLAKLIRVNDFIRYDTFVLDPAYIEELDDD